MRRPGVKAVPKPVARSLTSTSVRPGLGLRKGAKGAGAPPRASHTMSSEAAPAYTEITTTIAESRDPRT